ncbi:MAG: CPBP family intramembrane metalloprotease [Anaerolineae bacterium]|nr:CPBP family intramembrane metalloprotease [Anaerolineae bacterium]
MSALMSASPAAPHGLIRQTLARRPLLAYFSLAFLGTWTFFSPILLSRKGLGVWNVDLPDALGLLLFFLATYTGPLAAAFIVTAAVEGRAGVRRLLGRIVQWRVHPALYLLVLLGYPLVFAVGGIPWFGATPLTALLTGWPLYFTAFLPNVAMGLFLPALGEETGWRGFALPRLQAAYGPIVGSLVLGALHALWHLPVYFVPGAILPGAFSLEAFIANSAAIMMSTLIWTWLFNRAGGSVLFAMLIHATSNATSDLMGRLLTTPPDDPWLGAKILAVVAVLLIVTTRGRLGYRQA